MTGADHLKDWMRLRGFTQAQAARYMGFEEPYMSLLARGLRTPGLTNAIRLERLTGIPVEAWTAEKEAIHG